MLVTITPLCHPNAPQRVQQRFWLLLLLWPTYCHKLPVDCFLDNFPQDSCCWALSREVELLGWQSKSPGRGRIRNTPEYWASYCLLAVKTAPEERRKCILKLKGSDVRLTTATASWQKPCTDQLVWTQHWTRLTHHWEILSKSTELLFLSNIRQHIQK